MDQDYVNERLDKMVEEYRQNIVSNLDREYFLRTRFGDRVSDRVAAFGGSWGFIFCLFSFLILWLAWNYLPSMNRFDPYPFILLNLVLSFLAGFQAPFIMMAQNRHAARDKNEADIDFAINYRAENELQEIKKHLDYMGDKLENLQSDIAEIKKLIRV
jgi:uncharacterized membrane protein